MVEIIVKFSSIINKVNIILEETDQIKDSYEIKQYQTFTSKLSQINEDTTDSMIIVITIFHFHFGKRIFINTLNS